MNTDDISTLDLHDATLRRIDLDWERGLCELHLSVWSDEAGTSVARVLSFHKTTNIHIPRQDPWGPSVSINLASQSNTDFQIEMQSGDVISISAEAFVYRAN